MELKRWTLDYAEQIAISANNKKIADNLRNSFPHPYTKADAKEFIKYCIETGEEKELNRAIVIDGLPIGSLSITIGSDIFCKNAELGYWLAEEYWGKGIMTKAIKAICKLTFEKYDISKIYALPFSYNKGSCKTLERNGFSSEGILKNAVYKNGQFIDCIIYGLSIDDIE